MKDKLKQTVEIIKKIREVTADLNDMESRRWVPGQIRHEADKLEKIANDLYELYVHDREKK